MNTVLDWIAYSIVISIALSVVLGVYLSGAMPIVFIGFVVILVIVLLAWAINRIENKCNNNKPR